MLNYFIFKVIRFLSKLIPFVIGDKLCVGGGTLWYLLDKKRRNNVEANISLVCHYVSDGFSKKRITKLSKSVFVGFYTYLYEFFRCDPITPEWIKENVEVTGKEYIDEALKNKKGVIALTLHVGNWELGARITAALGYPLYAVALPFKNKSVSRLFTRQREECGVHSIEVGNAVKDVLGALKKNALVALLADYVPTDKGVKATLFGESVHFSRGPYALSVKTTSPIVPCILVRGGKKRFRLLFEKPILCDTEEACVREVMNVSEKLILNNPGQWCLFRDIRKGS
ncbi:MAG: lysophospholipid acyltransferase family protein [Candidatus Ancaeobacter aquaticus]|nr:lysophospholipid acyltransferase family protein [Candidatus Ancaeobacter aquaticus]